jgi:hypothetical protein
MIIQDRKPCQDPVQLPYIYRSRLILHPHQPRAWNKYVSDLNSECSMLTDVFEVRVSRHCKNLVRDMQHF